MISKTPSLTGGILNRLLPWVVCFTASLFFFYEFIQMSLFNALAPDLMQAFNISSSGIGILSSAYFYANIIFMFPAGILLDRFSTRYIILIAMCICVLGTFIFAHTHSFILALLARFLTGIGGSFPFLCCLRLASRWFPVKKLALVSGLFVTVAMLGGITAQAPFSELVQHEGWRFAIYIDTLLGLGFIACIALCVRDYPSVPLENGASAVQPATTFSVWQGIKTVSKNPQNWLYGLYTCMLNLPIFLLGQTWGGLYLTQVQHLTKVTATDVTMMIFFGTIVGSPLMGLISDRLGRRRMPMIIAAVISIGLTMLLMASTHLSFIELSALFFALGLVTSAQVISYPAISASNPGTLVGSALGLASVLIMSGGAFIEPLSGWLLDLYWQGQSVQGVHVYPAEAFVHSFLLMPLAFLLGLIALLFAKEPEL